MGLQDRDYLRGDEKGIFLGGNRMMVTNIVIITGLCYIVQLFAEGRLERIFSLQPDLLDKPWQFYQLFTVALLHSRDNAFHILGNMFVLWYFGREIEQIYGRREFLAIYVTGLFFSSLVWVLQENLAGYTVYPDGSTDYAVGASGAVSSVFMLYILKFPHRKLLFNLLIPMPAWVLGVIWILTDIFGATRNDAQIAFWAHLGGAAYGFVYFKTRFSFSRLIPRNWKFRMPKSRPSLRVHDPDRQEESMNEEVDRILQKIQEQGQDSLTSKERKILEKASRRYQQKHR